MKVLSGNVKQQAEFEEEKLYSSLYDIACPLLSLCSCPPDLETQVLLSVLEHLYRVHLCKVTVEYIQELIDP